MKKYKIVIEQLYLLFVLFMIFGFGMLVPLFFSLSEDTTLFLGGILTFTCLIGMLGTLLFEAIVRIVKIRNYNRSDLNHERK